MPTDAILWHRLDTPGHDACRLEPVENGWQLHGTAVFLHHGGPALLSYRVRCDAAWRTRKGEVRGWIGSQPVALSVSRSAGGNWTLNDVPVSALERCLDLDLGFTPATNLFQLRRIDLRPGQSADVPVAWTDATTGRLELLSQRYERRGATTYWYESPRFEYAALLEVDSNGFVTRYPNLWDAVPAT